MHKIELKLEWQNNYAHWILSIEQTLTQYAYKDGTIWDVITGESKNPGGTKIKAEK